AVTAAQLQERVERFLDKHQVRHTLEWTLSGEPFLTDSGVLVEAARSAIREITGVETTLSTSGDTSDGRFIAPMGAQVMELGPVNATIHKIDECVKVEDLNLLSQMKTTAPLKVVDISAGCCSCDYPMQLFAPIVLGFVPRPNLRATSPIPRRPMALRIASRSRSASCVSG
ncbi:MAG: succinyl-diaminopimelate desuccinylase, partial [Halothiobacillaceae bacterium]